MLQALFTHPPATHNKVLWLFRFSLSAQIIRKILIMLINSGTFSGQTQTQPNQTQLNLFQVCLSFFLLFFILQSYLPVSFLRGTFHDAGRKTTLTNDAVSTDDFPALPLSHSLSRSAFLLERQ